MKSPYTLSFRPARHRLRLRRGGRGELRNPFGLTSWKYKISPYGRNVRPACQTAGRFTETDFLHSHK